MSTLPGTPAARWAIALTEIPSVTGTADEAGFAGRLVDLLRASPLFADRLDDVWTLPVPGGRQGRACVCALLRGRGARTVMLTGHFDTVGIDDYGDLAHLACRPEALKPVLAERLRYETATSAEQLARADLEGPDFLPGRGLLDMKAGLAVMEDAAADPERRGNLLFLAGPDEEVNSAGARAAAVLSELARERGLEIVAAINLDALVEDGDGSTGRAVALGTIRKLLPSALVVGRATHASDAFRDLSAGAVATEVEWARELLERTGDEVAAGVTLLGMKDTKLGYNVTTPERVWMFWNVMTQRRGPAEVLGIMELLADRAAGGFVERLSARLGAALGDVPVLTFQALRHEVEGRGAAMAEALAGVAREAAWGLDLPEQSRIVTERA